MRNALSFDVEDYFQVEAFRSLVQIGDWARYPSRVAENTRRILRLLDERNVRATFFVLGWVAERDPGLVRAIQESGHEVGCHSYAHRPLYTMSAPEFRADTRRAKAVIEEAIGAEVVGYRAPTFSIVASTCWAFEILAEEGFAYDSSVFPIHHDRYGIPDAPRFPYWAPLGRGNELAEFPMTTLTVAGQNAPIAGGGYFRLLPYALIRAGLQRINDRERRPAIVYLHPWEIDPSQPRLPVGVATRFRHYVNLSGTLAKLGRLLDDFEFAPVAEVLADAGLATVRR